MEACCENTETAASVSTPLSCFEIKEWRISQQAWPKFMGGQQQSGSCAINNRDKVLKIEIFDHTGFVDLLDFYFFLFPFHQRSAFSQ